MSYTSSDAQSFIGNATANVKYDIIALHTLTNDIKSMSSKDSVKAYSDLICSEIETPWIKDSYVPWNQSNRWPQIKSEIDWVNWVLKELSFDDSCITIYVDKLSNSGKLD